MILELCIDTIEGARLGLKNDIDRVELCSALSVGGLTPSKALAQKCVDLGLEVHAMLRPREGNFVYSLDEIEMMQMDLEVMASIGAKGVVFGCLDAENSIDKPANSKLISIAKNHGLITTFHRAFDATRDAIDSLESIIQLGFDRLLSSGQKSSAIKGVDCLSDLVKVADNRIEIMAGAGVNHSNALRLANVGINALHFSSYKASDNSALGMGQTKMPDIEKITSIIRLFR